MDYSSPPPQSGFSIGKLWTDKKSRGVLIQLLATIAVCAVVVYLAGNVVENFQKLGKPFGFEFLQQESNYDINQHLIDYNSQSSHARAAVVGVLNTLLVAVCGIILATILGFILGVLRLSPNWLVNKLAYCYIEFVRNVPVLVHILLIHGILVHSLPKPKQAINMADSFFLTNRGFYMPQPVAEPLFWVVVASFVLGIFYAFWYRSKAIAKQAATGEQSPVFWVMLGSIIGLPILVFMLMGMPLTWELPALKGFNFKGGMALKPEFLSLWLALSLYTAAFIAENVRSGIEAVSHGQTEAALALGLPRKRTMNLVVIPQALRVIIPPLTSQYLNITKNSSLAIAIGYMDIVATIGGITLNQSGREMECMIIVLSLYLFFSLTISAFMNWYNKRISLVER
ncbi:amino acid ABC transporter permease [Chromatiales bacterium (ex Bugula neritina AB1)]|nr:amino acid ABC transporter permease [Chromatiales bacterium (ex Bugula neritina AB1)]